MFLRAYFLTLDISFHLLVCQEPQQPRAVPVQFVGAPESTEVAFLRERRLLQ